MSTAAISGQDAAFYRWSSGAWTKMAEVSEISGPSMERETIEVTDFDSDGWKEYISGLRDGGSVDLTMNWTRSQFDSLYADFLADTNGNYKVVLPDTAATTLEFEGFLTGVPLNISVGDKITMDVSIQVSGKPEVYDGSSGSPVTG